MKSAARFRFYSLLVVSLVIELLVVPSLLDNPVAQNLTLTVGQTGINPEQACILSLKRKSFTSSMGSM